MPLNPVELYPEWIPRCLVLELARYEQLAQADCDDVSKSLFSNADAERATLKRLINDQSMQQVWRSLSIRCHDKAVNFERFADALWLETLLAEQTVRNSTETRSQRRESLAEASKKLRELTRLLNRHSEIRHEADHLLSGMIASNLKRLKPDADNIDDLLFTGADAWASMLNQQASHSNLVVSDALGAALSITMTDAMACMAQHLESLQATTQEVKHVGKPLPILIRRLNVFFVSTFGQPLDDTVAEIINTALALPPSKLLDRTAVRAYTDKKPV